MRRALSLVCGLAVCAVVPAVAQMPYLTESEIRTAIVGATLDGHYLGGAPWSEAYLADGGLDYREPRRAAKGKWSFRPGNVFCTFYDPSPEGSLGGGCWLVLKPSANCFEFYVAGAAPGDSDEGVTTQSRWNAQGWRRGEASTCTEKPAV
jgi:hypothetical protein